MKDKVFDHVTPTDTDALWEGILAQQSAEEKPKRRFLWWWWATGMLLLGGIVAYVFMTFNEDNNNLATINKSKTTQIKTENEISDNNLATSEFSKIESIDLSSINPSKEEVVSAESTSLRNDVSIDVRGKNKTTSNPDLNARNNNSSNIEGYNSGLHHPLNNVDNNISTKTDDIDIPVSEIIKRDANLIGKASINKGILSAPESEVTNLISLQEKNTEHVGDDEGAFNSNNLTTTFRLNSLLAKLENDILPTLTDESKLPTLLPPPPTKPTTTRSAFSIGANFSYGIAKKQLKAATSDDGVEQHIKLREESETAQQVLSGGLDLQYHFRSGLYVKTGLQYEQITERFDYSNTTESTFFNDTATSVIIYTMDGSIEKEPGTESTRIRTQSRKIYNRYRMIDLPLILGYQPISTNRLNWFVEGGVLVNLSFMPRGEIASLYNAQEQTDLSNTAFFKNNFGISIEAGAGVSYRLAKNWSVWMSPKFRYQVGSMTDDVYAEYGLEQRFLRGAVVVGMRMGL